MKKFEISAINRHCMASETLTSLNESVKKVNEARAKTTDAEKKKALMAIKTPEQKMAFAAGREIRVELNLWSNTVAGQFFETTNLAENEWPQYKNMTKQIYNLLQTEQHGEAPVQRWARANSTLGLNMYQLDSGVVSYPLIDLQTGRILESSIDEVEENVGRSLGHQMDDDLWTLIDAAIGAFPAGTYSLDSRIVSNTIPASNDLDFKTEEGFTFKALKEVIDHCNLLGRQLRAIVVNPTELRDLWLWQHLVSTAASGSQDGREMITDEMKSQILSTGAIFSALGHTFALIPDNSRAKKYGWFFTDQPCGSIFRKPSMDKNDFLDELWMKAYQHEDNVEGYRTTRVLVPYIHDKQKQYFGKIQFVT